MMVSSTLTQYKESYKLNLEQFLNDYEDNTALFFLQKEKETYQNYRNALTKISDQIKMFTRDELKRNLVHISIAADLKKINTTAYNTIITEKSKLSPPEGVLLSLHFEKNNTININEVELENHIRNSVVILKYIGQEYQKALDVEENSNNSIVADKTPVVLEQIDRKLWDWLQEFEKTNYYISTPLAIEKKRDYVTDTYFNYEERYYKMQIKTCDVILESVPREKTILEFRKQFKKDLIDLRKAHPLPNIEINKLISQINSAFHLLEKFMDGTLSEYKNFLFNDHFSLFFNELSKPINDKSEYHELKEGYFGLLYQISVDYDKSTFENQEAYSNEDFNRDCNEIHYLSWDRILDFVPEDSEELEIKKPSIMDLIINSKKGTNLEKNENAEINPYPRIFKDNKAYSLFEKLIGEFGNTKENLSNYSFVFHKMTYAGLIHFDLLQKTYFDMLSEFDISIDRIKPKGEIGKVSLRESIYSRVKQTL
jgi:hypothetical protein